MKKKNENDKRKNEQIKRMEKKMEKNNQVDIDACKINKSDMRQQIKAGQQKHTQG